MPLNFPFFLSEPTSEQKHQSLLQGTLCLNSQYSSNQNRMPSNLKGLFLPFSPQS